MSVFDSYDLFNILFLDIETVPSVREFDELSEEMQELWAIKSKSLLRNYEGELEFDQLAELFGSRAGIYAEFGKIVCVSVGFLTRSPDGGTPLLRLKSFASHSEAHLLEDFSELLSKRPNFALCGHNIKEFDIPYLCRRMMINQLPLPAMLDIAGKKPWEVKHLLDTMEMWKFGDSKSFTSLRLLAAVFDLPSPKDDIAGGDVASVYWDDRDLDRIATYCEKDVLATVQLFLRMKRLPILGSEQVVVVR
ncbi:MAG: 3'-5' exonuclease [Saprospiraceae bacterium]|nr:3'-5' exonuclease [Saprospiraceae bacterium]